MRLRTAVLGMVMGTGLTAGAAPRIIRDWGLHRAWQMERDRAHPERPARLVEVPWNAARTSGEAARNPAVAAPPAVRAGMRVAVVREGTTADIHLVGTALETARQGETVAVRAGLGKTIVRGIVRGPGMVELAAEKTR